MGLCGEEVAVKNDLYRLRRLAQARMLVFVIRHQMDSSVTTCTEELSMAKPPRNHGKDWTADDLKSLKQLARENTPTRVMGLKLGRTAAAVQQKASTEGISLKPTNQRPYGTKGK